MKSIKFKRYFNPNLKLGDNQFRLIKGTVIDLDIGKFTASLVVESGKRLISLLLPSKYIKPIGIKLNEPIYLLIKGKDVTVFRDYREYIVWLAKHNKNAKVDIEDGTPKLIELPYKPDKIEVI
ncbi:MAG: hypothetical protein N2Z81_04400 [Hydrogenothermaceae bacterium]|nr:hypothetical protein [Hydrogenothermaceae bacterium]